MNKDRAFFKGMMDGLHFILVVVLMITCFRIGEAFKNLSIYLPQIQKQISIGNDNWKESFNRFVEVNEQIRDAFKDNEVSRDMLFSQVEMNYETCLDTNKQVYNFYDLAKKDVKVKQKILELNAFTLKVLKFMIDQYKEKNHEFKVEPSVY